MLRNTGIALMKRALGLVERQWPDMADAHMKVPLEVYYCEEAAAREQSLFETSPLALVASCEIARGGAPTGTCHNILTQTCCQNPAYTSYPPWVSVATTASGGRSRSDGRYVERHV